MSNNKSTEKIKLHQKKIQQEGHSSLLAKVELNIHDQLVRHHNHHLQCLESISLKPTAGTNYSAAVEAYLM